MVVKFPMVQQREGENPWVTYAKQQVYKKNSCINLVTVGEPGSGKSWALLSYLAACDPTFNIDRVFFKGTEFIKFINSEELTRGKAILFDEAGIDMNNLSWQNEINRGLNALFQTMRYKNYIFGMTVPYLTFLSKGVRTLMTCRFQTMGWNYKTKLSKIMPRVLEYNNEKDKFYKKRLMVRAKTGVTYCDFINLPAPPKELITEYEARKKEFTDNLYADIQSNLENYEFKKKFEASKASPNYLPPIQKKYLDDIKAGMIPKTIAEKHGVSERTVQASLRSLRMKGYDFVPVKVDGKLVRYELAQ